MTILVTGGCGFIGSNYIHYMLDKYPDIEMINYDALTYAGNLDNLRALEQDPRYKFVKGRVESSDDLKSLVEAYEVDQVVHFAAESHVDRSIEGSEVFVMTNVLGTQQLLEIMKDHWTIGTDDDGYPVYREGVRFVHISTDEVYGSLGPVGAFTEESPINPNNPYAASKASADLIVQSYNRTYKMPVVITRASNNYGPYQFPEKLIPLMIQNALEGKDLPVYGDGQQIRDWLYVLDHCEAIDLVRQKASTGEIYNIGGSNEWANIDIVQTILFFIDISDAKISYVRDRLGHDKRYALNCRKIKGELGWEPKQDFKEGLDETIKWYLSNKEWLSALKGR